MNCIVFQELSWVQWAVSWSTSAVTALGLQWLQVPLQHLGVVTAADTAHVGPTLVQDFDRISVEELSTGIPKWEGCVYYPKELFTHLGFDFRVPWLVAPGYISGSVFLFCWCWLVLVWVENKGRVVATISLFYVLL